MTLKGLIKLTTILQAYPLTIIQWQILTTVADNAGQTITDLVKEKKLTCGTPSDIAVSVKRLGEGRYDRPGLGLITKIQHEDDGRFNKLYLSDTGKELIKKLRGQLRRIK